MTNPADRVVLYAKYAGKSVSPGASIRPGGTYLRLTDSHHPDRDYTETP